MHAVVTHYISAAGTETNKPSLPRMTYILANKKACTSFYIMQVTRNTGRLSRGQSKALITCNT